MGARTVVRAAQGWSRFAFSMNTWRHGSISVRAARPRDLEAIARLENESFESDRVSRRSLREFLRAPHRPVTVATIDEELAGYVAGVAAQGRAGFAHLFARGRRAIHPSRNWPGLVAGLRGLRAPTPAGHAHPRSALRQRIGDRALRELRLPPVWRAPALLCGRGDRVTLRKGLASHPARNGEQFAA